MFVVLLCLMAAMGLVQVLRPRLLWKTNRPLQRPFVEDYDATEPTARGYPMTRLVGVCFLGMVTWMIVRAVS
ncbi:DUF6199 family natural product biosynthesis protein [Streptomyces sp. NPDC014748]|uniref:DUF6199 family natural product biosynthesis protein n=1 Tax=Streptomyces sp. NPDC014748 TaxID=3364905 RepID=UPI0037011E5B